MEAKKKQRQQASENYDAAVITSPETSFFVLRIVGEEIK